MRDNLHSSVDYAVLGDDMQLVEISLSPEEGVRGEPGSMIYMREGINMKTDTGGGFMQGLKRMISGEELFITTFVNEGPEKSSVAFAAPYPGKIISADLSEFGGELLCQRDAFLCAAAGVEIEVAYTKRFGAGFFGGEGFILQKLVGRKRAFLHAGGTVVEKSLEAGEQLRVDTGCIAAFGAEVSYGIEHVGGIRNTLFGGEGVYLATLEGPGTVYLQSLPFARLADRVAQSQVSSTSQNKPG